MFCESCGAKIEDNALFCESCGAKLNNDQEVPVAEVAQPENPAAAEQVAQPEASAQAVEVPVAAPKKEKKPIPKKYFLFGGIGAGVLAAIIIALIIIIPLLNRVDISKYIDIDFSTYYGENYYNGKLNVSVDYDANQLVRQEIGAKKVQKYVGSFITISPTEDLGHFVSPILQYCDIEYRIKGAEDTEWKSANEITENIKSTDVLEVKLEWNKGDEAKFYIKQYQKELGIRFNTKDEIVEIKVSDEITEEGLKVKEVPTFDILDYMVKNKVFDFYGIGEDQIRFKLNAFEVESNGYTFKHEADSYSTQSFLYNSDKDTSGTIYLNLENVSDDGGYNYSKGDKVKITIAQESIDDGKLFFAKTETTVTVDGDKLITSAQAKKNYDKIAELAKDKIWTSYECDTDRVTLYTQKSDDAKYEGLLTVVIHYTNTFWGDTNYYAIYLYNPYINSEGEIVVSDYNTEYIDNSAESEVTKYDEIDWEDYTAQTITK